jgi:hypothetical protein
MPKPPKKPDSWDCTDTRAAEQLKEMFVDLVQKRRIAAGQKPALRAAFLKVHGIAHGFFEVLPRLPKDYRVGVFAKKLPLPYRVWVRFSSDTLPSIPDLRTTLGIGIKLFDVPGPKLIDNGDTQDFILQNHDVFFVNTAADMCAFTKAGVVDGSYDPYLLKHPKTQLILEEMKKIELSVLTTTYWSGLPYRFGSSADVKYKLEPEQDVDSVTPTDVPNYLALDLANRLRKSEARFRFLVQFRKDQMPIDKATVRWSETESEPVQVATLILPRQDVTANGQGGYGENLAYNPWHSLAAHEPLGSISDARKVVYHASAAVRRDANGVPTREPGAPRPPDPPPSDPDLRIVKAAIHPSIGIARVGNSQNDYFLAPEVIEPIPQKPGFYRDAKGALKRQAVRFRVYGLNAAGVPVRELTASEASIEWEVHLANKKAAWYEFQLALDIPEAASAPPSMLRNPSVKNRADLTIDPGSRTIKGKKQSGAKFDTGKFMGKKVYLGELRTDEEGRLIVLGGRGVSASYDKSKAVTFANNDAWHDDVSDGPVTATVVYKGEELRVAPAWVVVAPPDYAPMQKSVRTMWDLMRNVAIAGGTLPRPVRPSFENDIRPLFERMTNLQWVNAGFAAAFGWNGPSNLSTPEWLEKLSRPSSDTRELRRTIANQFRNFKRDSYAPTPWPWLYGDAMDIPPAETPRQNTALTDTQLWFLEQWAVGNFDADYDPNRKPVLELDDVPIEERPAFLTRASLEYCLADAFHPGCEMTWPVRSASMYMAPFRFLHADPDWVEPGYGEQFILAAFPSGPLAAQVPGGVTRWMAIPWQTDTASCRSGYLKSYDPYVPSFWPARVPNQVLSTATYDVVMDKGRARGERLAAFANRSLWVRGLGTKTYVDQINNMVDHFGNLGVVEFREGPDDLPLPAAMQVEQLPTLPQRAMDSLRTAVDSVTPAVAPNIQVDEEDVDLTGIEKVRRFPHGLRRD